MNEVPDHPVIARVERTGYPTEDRLPICPWCGEECETIFYNRFGRIFGCDKCVTEKDSWEVADCFPEKE